MASPTKGAHARGIMPVRVKTALAKPAQCIFRGQHKKPGPTAPNKGVSKAATRIAITRATALSGTTRRRRATKIARQGPFADQSDNKGDIAGAAYVFDRGQDAVWRQAAYLKAPNAQAGDRFSLSVAISGDTVLAAAPEEDSAATGIGGDLNNESAPSSGAAYSFSNCPRRVHVFPSTKPPWMPTMPFTRSAPVKRTPMYALPGAPSGCATVSARRGPVRSLPFHCTMSRRSARRWSGPCSVAPVCFDIAGPSRVRRALFRFAICATRQCQRGSARGLKSFEPSP